MSWILSEEEISSILCLPAKKRYSYFVKKISDCEQLWSLRNNEGWVLAQSPNDIPVIPVWPHPDYAKKCAINEWGDCEASEISLSVWMERWIPGIIRDKRLIAVFPTPSHKGIVIEPNRLYTDIKEECEKY